MTLNSKIDKLIKIWKIKRYKVYFDTDPIGDKYWFTYDDIEDKIIEVKGKPSLLVQKIGQPVPKCSMKILDPSRDRDAKRIDIIFKKLKREIEKNNCNQKYKDIMSESFDVYFDGKKYNLNNLEISKVEEMVLKIKNQFFKIKKDLTHEEYFAVQTELVEFKKYQKSKDEAGMLNAFVKLWKVISNLSVFITYLTLFIN